MAVYEQPLNEKIRLFMRLKFLMERFNFHLDDPSQESCQDAVIILLELYNLSSRLDVKNAALHVLDFQSQAVRYSEDAEDADKVRIERILEKLEEKSKQLYSFRGQLGQHLKTHHFLNMLKQRVSIAGGVNGMDLPLFNYWLNSPIENRLKDLKSWVRPYHIAFDAIQLLMDLIYDSCETKSVIATGGFYQEAFGHGKDYQLLGIKLSNESTQYPEISAGKQRFSVRFVDASILNERGKQILDDIEFELSLYSY